MKAWHQILCWGTWCSRLPHPAVPWHGGDTQTF